MHTITLVHPFQAPDDHRSVAKLRAAPSPWIRGPVAWALPTSCTECRASLVRPKAVIGRSPFDRDRETRTYQLGRDCAYYYYY